MDFFANPFLKSITLKKGAGLFYEDGFTTSLL